MTTKNRRALVHFELFFSSSLPASLVGDHFVGKLISVFDVVVERGALGLGEEEMMRRLQALVALAMICVMANAGFCYQEGLRGNSANQTDNEFKPDQTSIPTPAPERAIILFDGKQSNFLSMKGEKPNWKIEDGALISTKNGGNTNHVVSKAHFRDAHIHVEFMLPEKGSGNSGLYIHGNYELQILRATKDGDKLTQNHVGALYGFAAPLVSAGKPAGEWQVYDVLYRAPRRNDKLEIIEKGSVTAWLNGKKVQDNTRFGEPRSKYHPYRYGSSDYLKEIWQNQKETTVGPLFLQDHGNAVKFRNIWLVPLFNKPTKTEQPQK